MQPARIGNPLRVVGGEGERQRVDDVAPLGGGAGAALQQHAAHVGLGDGAPADRPLHVEQPAFRLAAGEVDGDGAQPQVGLVLGLADRGADRALGVLDVDDAAAAHAAAALPAEAEHAQSSRRIRCGR